MTDEFRISPEIGVWQKTSERPPKMEDFASPETIEENKKAGHVNGLWVSLQASTTDDPYEGIFLAGVSIDFDNKLKWEKRCTGTLETASVPEPKWWRWRAE